jgi:hypothetical protein
VKIVRIYTGVDGQSHFEDLEIPQADVPFPGNVPGAADQRSEPISVESLVIRDAQTANEHDFHPAPRRQFVVTLFGIGEIVCGDGSSRRFGPGDIMLADDLTGQGHISRTVEARRNLMIPLSPTVDISAWRRPS